MPPAQKSSLLGYASEEYAKSLREFGSPRLLSRSGGWLLERDVPGTNWRDAMGCYPLFACPDWAGLTADFEDLAAELITITVVTDPFGKYTPELLRAAFPDLMRPFKEHYVVNLASLSEKAFDSHHQRNARKALREVKVEEIAPTEALADWNRLYDNLIARHTIKGLARFSHDSFAQQLGVPGIKIFRAQHGEETVGMTLWFSSGRTAYYHLGAYSDRGYELRASFAVFRTALEQFSMLDLETVDLGAAAGLTPDVTDGLTRFKRGWANATRDVYLCGRILDRERYDATVKARRVSEANYFPAYRSGEFV